MGRTKEIGYHAPIKRTDKPRGPLRNRLLGRTDRGVLRFVESFPTYLQAVTAGQQRFGKGHFMVDTGGYAPSRDTQLLRTTIQSRRLSVLGAL